MNNGVPKVVAHPKYEGSVVSYIPRRGACGQASSATRLNVRKAPPMHSSIEWSKA
jgi:hypothetical protein